MNRTRKVGWGQKRVYPQSRVGVSECYKSFLNIPIRVEEDFAGTLSQSRCRTKCARFLLPARLAPPSGRHIYLRAHEA